MKIKIPEISKGELSERYGLGTKVGKDLDNAIVNAHQGIQFLKRPNKQDLEKFLQTIEAVRCGA